MKAVELAIDRMSGSGIHQSESSKSRTSKKYRNKREMDNLRTSSEAPAGADPEDSTGQPTGPSIGEDDQTGAWHPMAESRSEQTVLVRSQCTNKTFLYHFTDTFLKNSSALMLRLSLYERLSLFSLLYSPH